MSKSKRTGAYETGMTMIMVNLSSEERRAKAEAANIAMDAALAAGVDSNVWLREQFVADLVYGVWQDSAEPGGVAVALLKGHGRLMLIRQGKRPVALRVASIRCTCAEEAEAMCLVFGDGRASGKDSS